MLAGAFAISAHLFAGTVTTHLPSTAAKCVKIDEEPSSSTQLRPVTILSCNYGKTGLSRRLLLMLALPERGLSIVAVERAFSFPELTTLYDHPRDASYRVRVKGHDGSWEATFDFKEAFYPTDAWRRPRFRPGKRPELINPRAHGYLSLRVALLPQLGEKHREVCSLRDDEVARSGQHNRWRTERLLQPPTDGAPLRWITTFRHGQMSAGSDVNDSGCVTELTMESSADRGAN